MAGKAGSGNGTRTVGYKKPPKEHSFTKDKQPSPELKSKGVKRYRDREKLKKEIAERAIEYIQMTVKDGKRKLDQGDDISFLDRMMMSYIIEATAVQNVRADFFDRFLGKAPTETINTNTNINTEVQKEELAEIERLLTQKGLDETNEG